MRKIVPAIGNEILGLLNALDLRPLTAVAGSLILAFVIDLYKKLIYQSG